MLHPPSAILRCFTGCFTDLNEFLIGLLLGLISIFLILGVFEALAYSDKGFLFACFGSFIVKLAEFLLFYFPKPVF
jgi:hypothetical protein